MREEDGYDLLRTAIVRQACEDYFNIKAGFTLPEGDKSIPSCVKFFKSEWFSQLCDLDGDYLIKMLNEKAASMVLKVDISKDEDGMWFCHTVKHPEDILSEERFKKKDQAITKAAELQKISTKYYRLIRRREGC